MSISNNLWDVIMMICRFFKEKMLENKIKYSIFVEIIMNKCL